MTFDMGVYQDIPRTALVMGGNWDLKTPEDDLVLSPESILRVWALGALAQRGLVDTAIFTAGLTRGSDNTPEAAVQHSFFRKEFPQVVGMTLIEEDQGHTTKMDAVYTREIVDERGLGNCFTLISTQDFEKRQKKVFERQGFDIVSVAAEPLVASLSPEHAEYVKRYRRSLRRIKWMAVEPVLRALQVVDPDSKFLEAVAARSRPNHGDQNAPA